MGSHEMNSFAVNSAASTVGSSWYDYTYYLYGYWNDVQDQRTKHYPLVDIQPLTMALIMYAYYALVTKIGPNYMRNRKPMEIRNIMFAYNVLMVGVNAFFFYEAVRRLDYMRRLLIFEYPDKNDRSEQTLWVSDRKWQ